MLPLRLFAWLILFLASVAGNAHASHDRAPGASPRGADVSVVRAAASGIAEAVSIGEVRLTSLPREAHETLALIKRGGPFPYQRDGTVFFNRERLLPQRARGYYSEYTVRTPGARTRGARRIVVGGEPAASAEFWYTDDHYRSFRRIRE